MFQKRSRTCRTPNRQATKSNRLAVPCFINIHGKTYISLSQANLMHAINDKDFRTMQLYYATRTHKEKMCKQERELQTCKERTKLHAESINKN